MGSHQKNHDALTDHSQVKTLTEPMVRLGPDLFESTEQSTHTCMEYSVNTYNPSIDFLEKKLHSKYKQKMS